MVDRAYVGRSSAPRIWDIEKGHVRAFADAIGDDRAIYRDEQAARDAGFRAIPTPATFAIALRANDPREGLEIDWKRLLHGEQSFRLHHPMFVGDRIEVVARIASIEEKQTRSGVMDVIVTETTGRVVDSSEIAFVARSTTLIRRIA